MRSLSPQSLAVPSTTTVALASAFAGAAAYAYLQQLYQKYKTKPPNNDPETNYPKAHDTVWSAIGGAMQASQLYIGDRLELYKVLREACTEPGSSITAVDLAERTGFHQRWLREWMAQQAAMGVLQLLPGEGNEDEDLHYRLPKAMAEVLANPDSDEYDIAMVSCVPSLVNRAKTMLPEAFATGLGRPYDESEVASGIDRQHKLEIRKTVIPTVIPAANHGVALKTLQAGCKVADLGCGAGNLVAALANEYPQSKIYGYDVSEQALSIGATNIARDKLPNAFLVDANEDPMGDHVNEFDVITTFDVLHDAPNPAALIQEVKRALKPDGVWILADIPARDTMRQNITANPTASTYFAFSTCLCMSCSLSTKDGAGLGTLGFSVPVATKMLNNGGFSRVRIITETKNTRWFEVMH